jgi:hypothetical protein
VLRSFWSRQAVVLAVALVAAALPAAALPAEAKQVCDWYAIAFCSAEKSKAETFVNGGWGQLIDTNNYRGFKQGYFCVVSGPQPQASAERDRTAAIASGVSASTYIKHACTDAKNVGD